MKIRRTLILFGKELRSSAGNFVIVFALVMPILFSLLLKLVFGDVFSGKPRLGFFDPFESRFTELMMARTNLETERYDSLENMIADVEIGKIESGYVVPQGFDQALLDGIHIEFTVYTWGETGFKQRLIADTALTNVVAEMAGLDQNVQVEVRQLGEVEITDLADQLLPLLILMAMMLGGVMSPAIALIQEKQQHTLIALLTTPADWSEVLAAKTLLGFSLGLGTSLATLAINQAFGAHALLLAGIIALGALAAALLGTLLGLLIKDMNSLLATLKAGGLLLVAPGILELVPKAPEWLARIFPTYYMIDPILEIAQRGAGWEEIRGEVFILVLILGSLAAGLMVVVQHRKNIIVGG